ncbi:meiotic recombination protein REC114 isoform X2 [Ochotona princeps]|uniref:meiotic recombination protein REC114 isoform X2 n=1 Tax=Ochotona princeps TaxID=9978 RepID=UPI0027154D38|nr:meiotic recombination protein REC114 isoform X2 [Ochotona princeps]
MAEAAKASTSLGLSGTDATQWPLQRYGRFMPLGDGEPPAPGQGNRPGSSRSWKVFESSEESGSIVLTIVISGHFFISQGQTLLEGFSLIGSRSWLKIVRRVDCLLFGTTNKSRMFRVQFAGESREQALANCCSCTQSLAQYVPVDIPGPVLLAGDSQEDGGLECRPLQQGVQQNPGQRVCGMEGPSGPGTSTSVPQLAQAILASEELPLAYHQTPWAAEELGPFLRQCLLDQHFPAFVEDVEKELRKLLGPSK